MARAFLPEDDVFVAVLDETERVVLSGLMQQTRLLLSPEVETTGDVFDDLVSSMGGPLAPGDQESETVVGPSGPQDVTDRDPALDRLLPTAHRGDDQVAAEFRRLTEEGLRQRKSGNLDVALAALSAASGDRVSLDATQAPAFLMALTDVRLLLAERMGMRTEEDAEALHAAMETLGDEPLGYAMAWYDFLTWLQETLTHALMGDEYADEDDEDDEGDDETGDHAGDDADEDDADRL